MRDWKDTQTLPSCIQRCDLCQSGKFSRNILAKCETARLPRSHEPNRSEQTMLRSEAENKEPVHARCLEMCAFLTMILISH